MLKDEGVNVLAIVRNRMRNKPIFLSCDGANKDMHYFIKMISFWFCDRVIAFLLDSDAAKGTNSSTADDVDHSLHKVDTIDADSDASKVNITGLCADAGGRGTRE